MLSLMPPSTETYVRTAPPSSATGLTVPTSYNVNVDGPAIARPGSIESRGSATPRAPHSYATMSHARSELRWGRRRVLRGVGDAEPATEVELGRRVVTFLDDLRMEADNASGGDLEARGVEDLRPDVGVDTEELHARLVEDATHRVQSLSVGDRQPELLVLVRRRDVLVGVCRSEERRVGKEWRCRRSGCRERDEIYETGSAGR